MLEKVRKYIDQHQVLKLDGRYLVALSGGGDSVALLRILLELGCHVEAAHCNFHLRGKESDRDEAFCHDLCARLGVPFHVVHFDTRAYAELHGISIEMAARELRYSYFRELLSECNLDGVCVAHHSDDSVETVLLNLVRGTGLDGLKGILPKNLGVIRPLLCLTRSEIIEYLGSVEQDYVTDSTNLQTDANRNKIRLKVIPELLKINPAAKQNILRTTAHVQDALALIADAVERIKADVLLKDDSEEMIILVPRLLMTTAPQTILWHLLKEKGFSSALTEQIFDALPGKTGNRWSSPSHELLVNRNTLVVVPKVESATHSMQIPCIGNFFYNAKISFVLELMDVNSDFHISKLPNRVCLDAGEIKFPLTVRPVQNADKFIPYGMKGSRLLSDFLTDRKLSVFEKRHQLVVVDASGRIVWVVGLRPDARFCITETTRKSLVIVCCTADSVCEK